MRSPDVPPGFLAAAHAVVVLTLVMPGLDASPAAGHAAPGASGRARHEGEEKLEPPRRWRGEHDAAITGLPYRLGVSCIVAEKARQPYGGLK